MTTQSTLEPTGFRHEALIYEGPQGFLHGTAPFIREGVEAGEPVLVVVADAKIRALQAELGSTAEKVHFADMAEVGMNPARIIPAWRDFLDFNGGGKRPVRGIGEPIWAGRGADELVEAQRHETLLNVAFDGSGTWSLLCPYDRISLDPAVLEEAERSHPYLMEGGSRRRSTRCQDLHSMAAPFAASLAEPPETAATIVFEGTDELGRVRGWVEQHALVAGLDPQRASELVLAAHEVATNSVRYGGGGAVMRIWSELDAVVCEVRDRGQLENPLAGRERPGSHDLGGRGLWMANQLCDLVQLRAADDGNVIRLYMRR